MLSWMGSLHKITQGILAIKTFQKSVNSPILGWPSQMFDQGVNKSQGYVLSFVVLRSDEQWVHRWTPFHLTMAQPCCYPQQIADVAEQKRKMIGFVLFVFKHKYIVVLSFLSGIAQIIITTKCGLVNLNHQEDPLFLVTCIQVAVFGAVVPTGIDGFKI